MEGDRKLDTLGGAPPAPVTRLPRLAALWLLFVTPLIPSDDAGARVRSLTEAGEYSRAVAEAKTAVNSSPDLLLYHGLALAHLERYQDARAIFRSGRKLYPRDERFLLELAGLAYREKRLGLARGFLREALGLDPRDEYGNEFLGALYLAEGDVAAALKYWNRVDKPLIQNVLVTPPPSIPPVLRERAITISGGQIFTLERLRETETNLARLDLFARSRIELSSSPPDRFDVTIRLLPAGPPLKGWPGWLLPMARGLPYETVYFDRTNIANRAVNFRSLWRWDSNKRRIDLELAGPIHMKPRFRYRIGVDGRDENWDIGETGAGIGEDASEFKLRILGLSGDLLFTLTPKLEWTTGLRFTMRKFRTDSNAALFADSWSFEQRNRLDYRLLDWPGRRLRINSAAQLKTGRVFTGAPSRFGILEGELSGGWRPRAQDDAWETYSRLRAGTTFGQVPFDKLFQLGMERDNDLWLRGHAGARNGKKGNAPLGSSYALLQTGFHRRILRLRFVEVRAGPFLDAGRTRGPAGRFGSGGWLFDTGMEAKIAVAGGFTWSVIYGRDLRGGTGAFYTAVRY